VHGRQGLAASARKARRGTTIAPMAERENITKLLSTAARDPRSAARLYDAVYNELQALARASMKRESSGHTLQPTALVNEAYLRLLPSGDNWQNRGHFFGAAAQAMRRILVDHARRRNAAKRGDGAVRVTFTDLDVEAEEPGVDVEALDEALKQLKQEDERLEQVVTMRYFAGLSIEQTAAALGTSPATVKRDWNFARAWLFERLRRSD
jgi:RNA polymerase sigma factor (TIGR02999 family)